MWNRIISTILVVVFSLSNSLVVEHAERPSIRRTAITPLRHPRNCLLLPWPVLSFPIWRLKQCSPKDCLNSPLSD